MRWHFSPSSRNFCRVAIVSSGLLIFSVLYRLPAWADPPLQNTGNTASPTETANALNSEPVEEVSRVWAQGFERYEGRIVDSQGPRGCRC